MNTSRLSAHSIPQPELNSSNQAKHKKIETPAGRLILIADNAHLLAVLWEKDIEKDRMKLAMGSEDEGHKLLCETEKQLNEYFSKQRKEFDLPIHFASTDFQNSVWKALLQIPYGETRTYLQIALTLGDRNATRAVGLANGKNPISIIVPCHRVIGANGKLTGYAGGLDKKALLLELERSIHSPTLF